MFVFQKTYKNNAPYYQTPNTPSNPFLLTSSAFLFPLITLNSSLAFPLPSFPSSHLSTALTILELSEPEEPVKDSTHLKSSFILRTILLLCVRVCVCVCVCVFVLIHVFRSCQIKNSTLKTVVASNVPPLFSHLSVLI